MALVDGVEPFVEIVVAHDDGEGGVVRLHHHPRGPKLSGEMAVVCEDRHSRFPQALLGPARRAAQRGPERRRASHHGVLAGDDISPVRQGNERASDLVRRVCVGERGNEVARRAAPVEKRQQIAMDPSAKQGVERLGDQERLPVADRAKFQMRGKHRCLDEAAVGCGELPQNAARCVLKWRSLPGGVRRRACCIRTS